MNKDEWQAHYAWYEYPLAALVALAFLALGVVVYTIVFAGALLRGMMNVFKSIRYASLALIVLFLVALSLFWFRYTEEIELDGRVVSITVDSGMAFSDVADSLRTEGLIDDTRLFKLVARMRGVDRSLWIGRYDFSGAVSLKSILDKLADGRIATIQVTIPEGLRIPVTAGLLAQALGFDSAEVVARCYDTAFCRAEFDLDNLEGYLFPETYVFPVGADLIAVLRKMVGDCRRVLWEAADDAEGGLAPSDVLTLASIIEAEARDGSEREIISSVYHNRLKKGMLLQADPTVRFALNRYKRKLYFKHLKVDSPYNTYKYPGLPPGPICSPGEASIRAAAHPAKTEYLYFVADGSGRHIFTHTLAEHNRAKEKVRRGD